MPKFPIFKLANKHKEYTAPLARTNNPSVIFANTYRGVRAKSLSFPSSVIRERASRPRKLPWKPFGAANFTFTR